MKHKSLLFINKSSFESFLNIKDNSNITDLSFNIFVSYTHAQKMIQFFESCGLISTKKVGRERVITLTPKGKDIQARLFKIKELLSESY